MNVKRTLALGVVGGALAVWLAAASTSTNPPATSLIVTPPRVVDQSGAELAAEIARLRERLRPSAQPAQARNLFRYQPRSAAGSSVAVEAAAPMPPTPPSGARAPSVVVPLTLVGMAEDPGDAGPVRSAILSGFGGLFIVKDGDAVADRYRVVKVGADGIDLIDISTHASLHIPVK